VLKLIASRSILHSNNTNRCHPTNTHMDKSMNKVIKAFWKNNLQIERQG